jgi:hypothetical protein
MTLLATGRATRRGLAPLGRRLDRPRCRPVRPLEAQVLVDVEWIDIPVFDIDELELSLSIEFNRWDWIDNP